MRATRTRTPERGQRGRQALVDGRRLVLWPGTPTHCACSVRVVRNGHCLFTAQLLALRARAADRTRERACLCIIVLRRGGVVLGRATRMADARGRWPCRRRHRKLLSLAAARGCVPTVSTSARR